MNGMNGMNVWYCSVHGQTFPTRGALQRDRNAQKKGLSNHSSIQPWCKKWTQRKKNNTVFSLLEALG
jgi:hypothetical protein